MLPTHWCKSGGSWWATPRPISNLTVTLTIGTAGANWGTNIEKGPVLVLNKANR
jgi:hypothetical protein